MSPSQSCKLLSCTVARGKKERETKVRKIDRTTDWEFNEKTKLISRRYKRTMEVKEPYAH